MHVSFLSTMVFGTCKGVLKFGLFGVFCWMAQEPNQNQKHERSEPFFQEPQEEPEPPEPFVFRNRNWHRAFC